MAPGPPTGRVAASIYMPDEDWRTLRRHALEHDVSASSIVAALLERYITANDDEQGPILARAQEIAVGRRRRSD